MIDLTMDEILEDLCHPGPPPGQWNLEGHGSTPITGRAERGADRLTPAARPREVDVTNISGTVRTS